MVIVGLEMLNGLFEFKWDRKDKLNSYNDTVVSNTDTILYQNTLMTRQLCPELLDSSIVVTNWVFTVDRVNLRQILSFKMSVQTRALGYRC